MVRQKLCIAERWQAVGMSQTGLSNRRVAQRVGVHHSVIDRFQATGTVEDRPRSGRPRKTTPREKRLIARGARRDMLPRLVVYVSVCLLGAMCLFGL